MNRPPLLALTALLLTACTGTEEAVPALRLAVLTDDGATLRTVTTGGAAVTPSPNASVTVAGGVALDPLPGGQRLALTLSAGIESRDVNLANPAAFAALPFTPACLTSTALSGTRDRLLTLSDCNGVQRLALYRADGTPVWTSNLPTFVPPVVTADTPPVRIAVLGEVGIVARPTLGGGSEVLRVAPETAGSGAATASTPVPTVAVRDLAPQGGTVYAATDSGVLPLGETGVPDATRRVAAFGEGRVDRLWTGAGSGTSLNLYAAWRDTALSGNSGEPLRVWDGVRTTAATVASVAELRDLSFAPDGNLYALTRTALTSYDTVFGLGQGNWRPTQLVGGLQGARAVTWLVP